MNKLFSRPARKRGISAAMNEMIMLGLAAFVVISMFLFFDELKSAVLGKKDDGSVANFNRLYGEVKELVKNEDEPNGYVTLNYFITDKYLVGFDKEWDDTKEVANTEYLGGRVEDNIYKPHKCGSSSCLCLFNDYNDWDTSNTRENELEICRSDGLSGKNIIFVSEQEEFINERGEIDPLTIGLARSDNPADDNYLVFDGDDFQVQNLYIEKQTIGEDQIVIYISAIDESEDNHPATKRKRAMDSLLS